MLSIWEPETDLDLKMALAVISEINYMGVVSCRGDLAWMHPVRFITSCPEE
jgi:hypothetical protein